MKPRVLLVDDHKMFRGALKFLLESETNIEIVGEAGDGQEALALAQKIMIDVVFMDVSIPVMNGIETTRRLLVINPAFKIIGLSAFVDRYYVMEMMNAGAAGYITKGEPIEEIIRAIDTVYHTQKKYLCPDIAAHVIDAVNIGASQESSLTKLSHREQQVLHFVAEGCSSPIIAKSLQLSPSTVEVHRRNIMQKLNLHSIADLTKYAIRNGLCTS